MGKYKIEPMMCSAMMVCEQCDCKKQCQTPLIENAMHPEGCVLDKMQGKAYEAIAADMKKLTDNTSLLASAIADIENKIKNQEKILCDTCVFSRSCHGPCINENQRKTMGIDHLKALEKIYQMIKTGDYDTNYQLMLQEFINQFQNEDLLDLIIDAEQQFEELANKPVDLSTKTSKKVTDMEDKEWDSDLEIKPIEPELSFLYLYLSANLFTDIIGFSSYAIDNGYAISQDTLNQLFRFLAVSETENKDLIDIEPLMRPFFVQDAVQDMHFLPLIKTYKKFITSGLSKDEFFKQQNKTAGDTKKKKKALENKQRDLHYMEYQRDQMRDNLQRMEEQLAEERKQAGSWEQEIKEIQTAKIDTEDDDLRKIKKFLGKYQEEYDEALSYATNDQNLKESIRSLSERAVNEIEPYTNEELNQMKDTIRKALRGTIGLEHAKELMKIMERQFSLLNRLEQAKKEAKEKRYTIQQKINKVRDQEQYQKNMQEQLDSLLTELVKKQKELEKESSQNHREEFLEDYYHASVRATGVGVDGLLDTDFKNLTSLEKDALKRYIRENARQFRTRMTHNLNAQEKRKLDFPETIKLACATDGVPIRLRFKKPKRKKTKLVLILDVSGSCRDASELMLYFMFYMQEMFPGGCLSYVFTNQLYDISEFMKMPNGEDAIRTVLSTIPTRGVYSDYNRPLAQICEEHISKITSDSMLFFIGDARNNKNPSGEEYLKIITRKAKYSYWLNTDRKEKWNQGDSIIGTYAPYINYCEEVRSPLALIASLMKIRG